MDVNISRTARAADCGSVAPSGAAPRTADFDELGNIEFLADLSTAQSTGVGGNPASAEPPTQALKREPYQELSVTRKLMPSRFRSLTYGSPSTTSAYRDRRRKS